MEQITQQRVQSLHLRTAAAGAKADAAVAVAASKLHSWIALGIKTKIVHLGSF